MISLAALVVEPDDPLTRHDVNSRILEGVTGRRDRFGNAPNANLDDCPIVEDLLIGDEQHCGHEGVCGITHIAVNTSHVWLRHPSAYLGRIAGQVIELRHGARTIIVVEITTPDRQDAPSGFLNEQTRPIDQAFLGLSGFEHRLEAHARALRATVLQWTGIPVSVGIAPTKTLAKAANRTAKKDPTSGGVALLLTTAAQELALGRMELTDLWGVARRTAEKLIALGITTPLQLRDADPRFLRERFSVVLERTVHDARHALHRVRGRHPQSREHRGLAILRPTGSAGD